MCVHHETAPVCLLNGPTLAGFLSRYQRSRHHRSVEEILHLMGRCYSCIKSKSIFILLPSPAYPNQVGIYDRQ